MPVCVCACVRWRARAWTEGGKRDAKNNNDCLSVYTRAHVSISAVCTPRAKNSTEDVGEVGGWGGGISRSLFIAAKNF